MTRPDQATTRKILLMVPLAALAVNAGQSVLFATMPMLGRQLMFSELQITSLVSLSALTYFFLSPFWGRYSNFAGRKRVIVLGLSGYVAGALVFNGIVEAALAGWVGGLTLYLILLPYRVLHTSVMAATHPASGAYVADVTSVSERINGMALLGGAIAFGACLGPMFIYFSRFGILVPIYISTLFCALVGLYLFWRLPDRRIGDSDERGLGRKLSYFDPRYRVFLLIGLGIYSMMSLVQQTLGFYLQDHLRWDAMQAMQGYAVSNMLASLVMMFTQLGLVRKLGLAPVVLLRLGMPVVAASYLGLALSDTFLGISVSMMLFGLGMGLAGPAYTASASVRVKPHEQGALAGLAGSIPGLGFVLGPLVGGALYGVEQSLPYITATVGIGALALYVMTMPSSSPQREAADEDV